MAHPAQLGFQDAASPILEELLNLHDYAMMVAFIISIFVLYIIILVMTTPLTHIGTTDAQIMETLWTILPAAILILIALPSLRILYLMDEVTSPHLTIKALGHQWYWSYEYTDYEEQTFDSYMIPTQDLKPGHQRLLEVDYRMLVPTKAPIRMLISATDVLHSWAVPSLGVKTDAVPGRLNQTTFTPSRPGLYYGQCSEICGANHSFMPITVEVTRTQEYERWAELFANLENTT